MIGIYKITNPLGQIYIGSSKSIALRFRQHELLIGIGFKLGESIKLHGSKNHKYEVIEECEPDQLLIRERYWQDCLMSHSPNNLNMRKANNTKYINGKRQQSTSKKKSYVLDMNTGVYYETISEVATLYSMPRCALGNKINNNKTQFKIV